MKRRLFKLVVFLLLGAVVNVAVAWSCTLIIRTRAASWERIFEPDLTWVDKYRVTGDDVAGSTEASFFGVTMTRYPTPATIVNSKRRLTRAGAILAERVASGWPFKSLDGGYWNIRMWDENIQAHRLHRTVRISSLPLPYQTSQYLPVRPIWPGFAINTVFYALILLVPFAPFTLRCFIRRKRGHCINCGYDLRGAEHEVCPECGVDVGVAS